MKQNYKNIFIGIIATIILGLSCYFIYDKYGNKDNNGNGKIVEDDKKIQEDLINIIKEYGFDALAYEEEDVIFSENPNNSQLYLATIYFDKINKDKDYIFTREELDAYYEKLYGYKPSSYPNISCITDKENIYLYKENKYVKNSKHKDHSYYEPGFIDSYITDYLNNDNTYTVSILFLNREGKVNEDSLFKDESNKKYSNEEMIKYFEENISDFTNTVKYRFTFEKNSGRYILKSFKKVL